MLSLSRVSLPHWDLFSLKFPAAARRPLFSLFFSVFVGTVSSDLRLPFTICV